ncbi:MAG: (d)CMP kinase [Nitrospirota bacterium]
MREKFIIAIDGPSGAGKSTASKLLSKRLGYIYVDTGALYRAIAWKVKENNIDSKDEAQLEDMCNKTDIKIRAVDSEQRVYVDGKDVNSYIRTPEIGMMSSKVSSVHCVRKRLLELQRQFGKEGGAVIEGRDIGTVVFPDAEVKFFLKASDEERGRRRYIELKGKGHNVSLEDTTEDIKKRDYNDSKRDIAPLCIAEDAIVIDSTGLDAEGVVKKMLNEISKKKAKAKTPHLNPLPIGERK